MVEPNSICCDGVSCIATEVHHGNCGRATIISALTEESEDENQPLLREVVREAWTIYRSDVLPEQEKEQAVLAQSLLDAGIPRTEVARRLKITSNRLETLLSEL